VLPFVIFFGSVYSFRRMYIALTTQRERRWAIARLVLGFLQIMGAGLSLGLLVELGVSRLSLIAVAITGLLTTLSVLLFGGRKHRPAENQQERRN